MKHKDVRFFRSCGIEVSDERRPEPSGYLVTSWLLFWIVAGAMAWWGAWELGAWGLRALGVHIAGI